ncbi:hypothetical protein VNO77_23498 [Canavalia gladiata]|uniref:Uncharacterized protein n=1 Tax=Canavalia gladiata TaxID=3824 RepID=A0AAN9L518_CANGL
MLLHHDSLAHKKSRVLWVKHENKNSKLVVNEIRFKLSQWMATRWKGFNGMLLEFYENAKLLVRLMSYFLALIQTVDHHQKIRNPLAFPSQLNSSIYNSMALSGLIIWHALMWKVWLGRKAYWFFKIKLRTWLRCLITSRLVPEPCVSWMFWQWSSSRRRVVGAIVPWSGPCSMAKIILNGYAFSTHCALQQLEKLSTFKQRCIWREVGIDDWGNQLCLINECFQMKSNNVWFCALKSDDIHSHIYTYKERIDMCFTRNVPSH